MFIYKWLKQPFSLRASVNSKQMFINSLNGRVVNDGPTCLANQFGRGD
jgi:hypothetical protein